MKWRRTTDPAAAAVQGGGSGASGSQSSFVPSTGPATWGTPAQTRYHSVASSMPNCDWRPPPGPARPVVVNTVTLTPRRGHANYNTAPPVYGSVPPGGPTMTPVPPGAPIYPMAAQPSRQPRRNDYGDLRRREGGGSMNTMGFFGHTFDPGGPPTACPPASVSAGATTSDIWGPMASVPLVLPAQAPLNLPLLKAPPPEAHTWDRYSGVPTAPFDPRRR